MIVESLFSTIDRGKSGMNIGVSTGLPKLDNITYGIQSCWMTVIGGDSGSGKSSLCLYTAVYRPYMQYLLTGRKLNINWLLFSFELSSEVIFAKLLSIYIYEVYNRVISYGDMLSFNQTISDEDYLEKQPRDCQKLIYVIKAGGTTQGPINSTCFSDLVSGKVHFLIREQDAKTRLLSTEKGMKMPIEMRVRKLRPYTLTGILIDELLNMRIKDGNINQGNLILERINTNMTKDKFSAFEYGLYRIKDYEMKYMKQKARQKRDLKQFMLFSSRGGGK